MIWLLALLAGIIIGTSLGLTGGGGALFAVPIMVYGLGLAPHDAVGLSLAVVGATSFVGAFFRWRQGEVALRTGVILAIAGMLIAPVGVWIAGKIPESLLLILFAILMLVSAIKLWQNASRNVSQPGKPHSNSGPNPLFNPFQDDRRKSAAILFGLGIVTGLISGLFGVGGGFVIVPALILVTQMPIQQAVGTSLMVISLISVSGVASHALAGRTIDLAIALPFTVGSLVGLFTGQKISHILASHILQRGFAVAVLLVALFVIIQNIGF